MQSIEPTTKTINDLSEEILVEIFKYFKCGEMVETLFYVCEKWRSIVLKMNKSFRFDLLNEAEILEAIHKFPNTITGISLSKLRQNIDTLLSRLRLKQINLKHVSINDCKISSNVMIATLKLRRFLEFYISLENLTLKGCKVVPEKLLDVFPKLINLRSLTIGSMPELTSLCLMSILLNVMNLTCIHLYRIERFTDQDMKFLLSNERLNSRLREFSLDQVAELTSTAYQHILQCKNLEKLCINYSTGFSPETLMKIRDELPQLRSLVIERVCRIKSRNLSSFFQDNPLKLNEFGLTDCCTHLEDDALMTLLHNQHKNLLHLKLFNCSKLTKASEILEKCEFLKTLDLTGCDQICHDVTIFPSCLTKIVLPSHLKERHKVVSKCESIILQFQSTYDDVVEINA